MTFGVSVAAYNKKPNVYLQKATAPITPAAPAAPVAQPLSQPHTPITSQPNGGRTALSGSTAPAASGFVSNVQTQVYQPTVPATAVNRAGSEYKRLSSINQISDARDMETQQRIASANSRINAMNRNTQNNTAGYEGGGDFTGDGDSGLDAEQLDNARAIANIGKQRGFSDQGIQIALMTALTESGLRNLNYGDRDSVGLFQQRTSQGWGSVPQIMNREYSAGKFYEALGKINYGAMSPWQAAQAVQRSFDPTGSNFQRQYALAQRAYGAIFRPTNTPNNAAGWISAMTNKYVDLDGAYGAQCVDLYNAYTSSFVGGTNYMVGYAPEIFNKYDTKNYTRYAAQATPGRMGDVAVFRPGGPTPLGHVGIVIGDNGNGTLRMLSANYGSGPSGTMNTAVHNISKGSLMGYLRPNKLRQ